MKIRVNGIQINYELSGKDNGPVVVLSHALGCNLNMWRDQESKLASEFKVLRFDTRGHGLSDAPSERYSLDLLIQDALCLLDALNIEKVHWVGMSMGGMLGQAITINNPTRIASLTLCDTGPFMPPEKQIEWKTKIDMVRNQGIESIVQESLKDWFTPEFHLKETLALNEIRQQLLSTSTVGYEGCVWAIMGLNFIDRIKEIMQPTLIMVGGKDLKVPVGVSKMMHEKISGSELVVIPEAAHLSSVGQPEVFNHHLLKFLRKAHSLNQGM